MTEEEVQALIAAGETLTVEFKGEERSALNDRDLVEAVVCLANTQGGTLLIGVEDNGRITGARPRHRDNRTDGAALAAMVRSRTVPSLEVRVTEHVLTGGNILELEVPRSPNPVATSEGTCVRRVIAAHGPECQPWFPHQQPGGVGGLGSEDLSAHTLTNTEWSDLDPLHFKRARRTIAALQGDRTLLELGDEEMAKALRVVETRDGRLIPNLSGLLLFGKTASLETHLPTHQAAFQVLTAGADIRVNDFFRSSLLEMAELFDARFQARNEEREVQIGMVHTEDIAELIQRSVPIARGLLERLVEEGLVEARGERRGRAYHFSAAVYRQLGRPEHHTRAHGIDPIRHEAMVLQFTQDQGSVRRENVMELCGLDRGAAYRLLRRLAYERKLVAEGTTRARVYRLPEGLSQ